MTHEATQPTNPRRFSRKYRREHRSQSSLLWYKCRRAYRWGLRCQVLADKAQRELREYRQTWVDRLVPARPAVRGSMVYDMESMLGPSAMLQISEVCAGDLPRYRFHITHRPRGPQELLAIIREWTYRWQDEVAEKMWQAMLPIYFPTANHDTLLLDRA